MESFTLSVFVSESCSAKLDLWEECRFSCSHPTSSWRHLRCQDDALLLVELEGEIKRDDGRLDKVRWSLHSRVVRGRLEHLNLSCLSVFPTVFIRLFPCIAISLENGTMKTEGRLHQKN